MDLNITDLSDRFERQSAQEILSWCISSYGRKIGFASSFGLEDVVIIDIMSKIDKDRSYIFTLDTGRLNQETYDLMDKIRKKYDLTIDVFFPPTDKVEEMVREKGLNLMYDSVENRKLCCNIRKVIPLKRALQNLDGWITGLRREQTSTRANIKKIELDNTNNNILKINPLADWTSDMVLDYIRKNNVPYNKLHDVGYPSIGCEPCTRSIKAGEDPRAGRWWWENSSNKECGLHWDPIKQRNNK